jgi:hypothetical protein
MFSRGKRQRMCKSGVGLAIGVALAMPVGLMASGPAGAITDLSITNPDLPTGTVGVFYSQQFQVSGGEGPYTFTLTSGVMPSGLSLSSAGVVSGTPVAQANEPVVSRFSVDVTDQGSGQMMQNVYTPMEIDPAGYQAPPPVTITPAAPSTLPEATTDQPYSMTFQVSGGTPPYSWGIVAGNLPSGFTFDNGTITGEGNQIEQSTFDVGVFDSGEVESLNQYQFIDQQQGNGGNYTLQVGTGVTEVDPTLFNVLTLEQESLANTDGLVNTLDGDVTSVVESVPHTLSCLTTPDCIK